MKTLFLSAVAASLMLAAPVAAKDKLSYLSAPDAQAIEFFKCSVSVQYARDAMRADGYDAYTSIPGTFDKAGRAAVVKAALLAEADGEKPQVKKISFTSEKAKKLVKADIDYHVLTAAKQVANLDFLKGVDELEDCLKPENLDKARAAVDWFNNDVALFEELK